MGGKHGKYVIHNPPEIKVIHLCGAVRNFSICNNPVDNEGYCEEHTCHIEDCNDFAGKDNLCKKHLTEKENADKICLYKLCEKNRAKYSEYCNAHTCIDKECNKTGYKLTTNRSRLCDKHDICQVMLCGERTHISYKLCELHRCFEHGCQNIRLRSDIFCSNHKGIEYGRTVKQTVF